jgi:hypothetical protein
VTLKNSSNGVEPSSLSATDAPEYFSDRTYRRPELEPFNPDATDRLGLVVTYGGITPGLAITLKLETWGSSVPMTPVGCVGDNMVFGTAGQSVVSIAFGGLRAR